MSKSLRLFIASHISIEAATPLLSLSDALVGLAESRSSADAIRWTPPAQWHLTWHFLGDTPEELVPVAQAAMDTALAKQAQLSATWQELRWWPSRSRPQVLVCRLEATPLFQAVYETIGQGLQNVALASAIPVQIYPAFKPHITLARIKSRGRGHPLSLPTLPELSEGSPPWHIDAVTLYSSSLTATGAIYTPLYTTKLG